VDGGREMSEGYLRYIVQGTNEIDSIMRNAHEPTERDIERALTISCNALKMLVHRSEELFLDLQKLTNLRRENANDFNIIVGSVRHFTNFFLEADKQAMYVAGLSREAVDVLAQKAKELRAAMLSQQPDPYQLQVAINDLRNETCDAANELIVRRQRRFRLIRFVYVLGGAAIVGINASPIAAGIGLSPAGIAVSGAMGGALMGTGLARTDNE
jgi:hypothetical protein